MSREILGEFSASIEFEELGVAPAVCPGYTRVWVTEPEYTVTHGADGSTRCQLRDEGGRQVLVPDPQFNGHCLSCHYGGKTTLKDVEWMVADAPGEFPGRVIATARITCNHPKWDEVTA